MKWNKKYKIELNYLVNNIRYITTITITITENDATC